MHVCMEMDLTPCILHTHLLLVTAVSSAWLLRAGKLAAAAASSASMQRRSTAAVCVMCWRGGGCTELQKTPLFDKGWAVQHAVLWLELACK